MTPVKFIHCADLHIGTPFKGISAINPELGELLYQCTYQAFDNIIDLAVQEQVDCVLICGDIYDSEDKSLQAQLRFRSGLQRLSENGIPAFVVFGNHDPLSGWAATLEWPDSVHFFPGDNVLCIPLTKGDEVYARIYGISHARPKLKENLALKFRANGERGLHIALLHTNAGGNAGHEAYAPCSLGDLLQAGMDYWALGHIHLRSTLRAASPAIVYPGCSQATHIKESGARGCVLVTLESGKDPEIKFVPVDVVRYEEARLDISACSNLDEIRSLIITKCREMAKISDNRTMIIRLSLEGRTALNSELQRENSVHSLMEDVREQLSVNKPVIWLEKLTLHTAGVYDLDQLRNGKDFIADIIAVFDEMLQPESQSLEEFRYRLTPLYGKWQGHEYLDELSGEQLAELVVEARNQMIDLYLREKDANT